MRSAASTGRSNADLEATFRGNARDVLAADRAPESMELWKADTLPSTATIGETARA